MKKTLTLIITFMLFPAFSGCLEAEDKRTIIEEPGIFDFGRDIPDTTWYHAILDSGKLLWDRFDNF